MAYRGLLVFALVAASPAVAAAQFTTFIPQPTKVEDSVATVVAVKQKVHVDSVSDARLTNIKTWVDSAAATVAMSGPVTSATPRAGAAATKPAVSATPRSGNNTSITTVTRTKPTYTTVSHIDTIMPNGRRAPATASALPLVLLAGVAGLGFGFFLLASSRETRQPSRTRDRA